MKQEEQRKATVHQPVHPFPYTERPVPHEPFLREDINLQAIFDSLQSEMTLQQNKRDQIIAFYLTALGLLSTFLFSADIHPLIRASVFSIDGEISDSFETRLSIAAGKDEQANRIWTLDQFCFTDWESDVVRGMPTLYFETELETVNRNGFTITLTRTDRNGNTERYMPALFRYAKSHPRYEKEGETISFGGKINAPAEKGCFALSFAELLKLPEGSDFGDFTWGFELAADKGNPVTVYGATLYFGGSDTALATIRGKKTVKRKAGFTFSA